MMPGWTWLSNCFTAAQPSHNPTTADAQASHPLNKKQKMKWLKYDRACEGRCRKSRGQLIQPGALSPFTDVQVQSRLTTKKNKNESVNEEQPVKGLTKHSTQAAAVSVAHWNGINSGGNYSRGVFVLCAGTMCFDGTLREVLAPPQETKLAEVKWHNIRLELAK